jgi:hypothetical protein
VLAADESKPFFFKKSPPEAAPESPRPNSQKFFASFFQKRRLSG